MAIKLNGERLRFVRVVKREQSVPAESDNSRTVNRILALYISGDGKKCRKSFESYGEPAVPEFGSHTTLNAAREQWR